MDTFSYLCILLRATYRLVLTLVFVLTPMAVRADDTSQLGRFLSDLDAAKLVGGASGFGAIRDDLPVAPVLKDGKTVAWAFLTSDFAGTTGYSGKPIHVVAAIDADAVMTGAMLVEHSEPIVLVGIPEAKVRGMIGGYTGLDLKAEADESSKAHDLDIISGATVTMMVIDDSLVRGGLKVARAGAGRPVAGGAGGACARIEARRGHGQGLADPGR